MSGKENHLLNYYQEIDINLLYKLGSSFQHQNLNRLSVGIIIVKLYISL